MPVRAAAVFAGICVQSLERCLAVAPVAFQPLARRLFFHQSPLHDR